jgi:DNA-binding NtrC family response regulator
MQEVYFIAKSEVSKEIVNSVRLLKNIGVNVLICGQAGVGKKTLAREICADEPFGSKDIQEMLKNTNFSISKDTIVVDSIDKLSNFEKLAKWANLNSIRVIATFNGNDIPRYFEEFFPINIYIPPLSERKEDVKPLIDLFSAEASSMLGIGGKKPDKMVLNLDQNAISLRKSIYFSYLFESIGEGEVMLLLEKLMFERMNNDKNTSENHYRDFSYLFEVPLLRASQKIHKSQLQMAKYLGLNRITLRKKLETYKELI